MERQPFDNAFTPNTPTELAMHHEILRLRSLIYHGNLRCD